MSKIARWSYKALATVRPFIERDGENGGSTYGEPYEILCTWLAEAKEYREAGAPAGRGVEFISNYTIYCEDPRPKYLDQILLSSDGANWQDIRLRLEYDAAMFNDIPDYKLVT